VHFFGRVILAWLFFLKWFVRHAAPVLHYRLTNHLGKIQNDNYFKGDFFMKNFVLDRTLTLSTKFTAFTKCFFPLPSGEGDCVGELVSRTQAGEGSIRNAAFTLAEGGQRPLLNSGARRVAFTLAEILITLAVIGIVAVLTIPGVVKNHQERAWTTAQDLFSKKLEVAMKAMATNSTVSGYDSTESFVNELKKYIKITKVCTDDVTKCFADKVVWNAGDEPVEVTNSAVKYEEKDGYDWAETVGIQLNNGVNALIAYNKQCDADPFNNQEAITAKCVGVIYDVSGFKTPNTNGKDILANGNIKSLGSTISCVYTMSDGTCFAKILGPDTGYTPIPKAETATIAAKYGVSEYTGSYDSDYWLGAMEACGGPSKMPTKENLKTLAQEMYNTTAINDGTSDTSGLTLDTDKAAPFLAQSPGQSFNWFNVWSLEEDSSTYAYNRYFYSDSTYYDWDDRDNSRKLAVCLGD